MGDGPPLILVRGWSMDMRSGDSQLLELANDFTVIRYDRRGWGESSCQPDVSRDPVELDRLMEELEIDSAFVLGHSQGADVALRFASLPSSSPVARRPEPDGRGLAHPSRS